jgi:hypothetical protein
MVMDVFIEAIFFIEAVFKKGFMIDASIVFVIGAILIAIIFIYGTIKLSSE